MLTFVCVCRLLTETTSDCCFLLFDLVLVTFCVCLRVSTDLTSLPHQRQDVVVVLTLYELQFCFIHVFFYLKIKVKI